MTTEPAPEPLTAEDADWLPTVRLALNYGFPADIDVTRRLLDIIDRLDRTIRVATPSSVTPDLRDALDAILSRAEHSEECPLNAEQGWSSDPGRCSCGLSADAEQILLALASVTPSEPTLDADLRTALLDVWDNGYMPMYNGRPSCPFCANFVDDEETHKPACVLARLRPGGER